MSPGQYAALLGVWIAGIVIPGPDVFLILRNAFLSTRRNAMLTAVGIVVGNAVWITLSLLGVTVLISGNHVLKLLVQIAGALFLARMGYGSLRGGLATRAARPSSTGRAVGGTGVPGDDDTAQPVSAERPLSAEQPSLDEQPGLAGQPLAAEDAVLEHEIAEQSRSSGFLGAAGLTPWRALVQGAVTNLANAKALVFFVALFGSFVPADVSWAGALTALGLLIAVALVWFLFVAWVGSIPALAARLRDRTAEVEMVSGVVFLVVAAGLLVEAALAF